jgi:hypothetical protein
MRTELREVPPGWQRWRFALGCLTAIVTPRSTAHALTNSVLSAGALTGAVVLTAPVPYPPLRAATLRLVATVVALGWLGRFRGPLGPVRASVAARLTRAGLCLMVGVMTLRVVLFLRAPTGNPVERSSVGAPMLTLVLATYLTGFLAVTARRGAATTRALGAGVAAGLAAALLWLAIVLILPPVPESADLALALIAITAGVAAYATAGTTRRAEPAHIAALLAGAVAALSIVMLVAALSAVAPPSMIPHLAEAALTPSARLAQSRVELEDPYVAVLFVGGLLAAALALTSRRARGATRA